MNSPRITVLGRQPTPILPKKKSKRALKTIITVIVIAIILLGGFLLARAINLTNKIFVGQKTSLYNRIADLVQSRSGDTKLIGEDQGQINVLLLGIGGEGHDGPYLTDTIILAQIRPADNKVSLISIPRDYFVPAGYGSYEKINAVFSDGYVRNHDYNEAGAAIRKTVEKLSGLEIPYFAVLDFKGFAKAIDELGGVNIDVQRTFTDYSFPNDATQGFLTPQTFKAGPQQMNGATALIFARSRHAAGTEGSDFARGQRQQLVMKAVKAKVLELNLITDAGKINSLLSILGDHFHTNISLGELYHLYKLAGNFTDQSTISLSLDPDTGIVCNGTDEPTGAFIITLCPGKTARNIEDFFKDSFVETATQQKATVWLADSTKGQTLYKAAQKKLSAAGYSVLSFKYGSTALDQTIFYQANKQPLSAAYVTKALSATEVSLPPPGLKVDPTKVDMIIILGGTPVVTPTAPVSNTNANTNSNSSVNANNSNANNSNQ